MFFEGEGEFFPLGEQSGAFCAEGFEFGGVFLGLFGGGEVAEAGFGGGDGGFDARDLGFDVVEAVFELFEFDGVQALDGDCGFGRKRSSFARSPHIRIDVWGTRIGSWIAIFRCTGICGLLRLSSGRRG